MAKKFKSIGTIHPHSMDGPYECGRTCAQVIIAAVTVPSTAANSTPIVSQQEIKNDENVPTAPWYFTPVEMRHALRKRSGRTDWSVVVHADGFACLASIQAGLGASGHRQPVPVMHGARDHWVVYYSAQIVGTDTHFGTFSPSPQTARVHTFRDDCAPSGMGGDVLIDRKASELVTDYLIVEGNAPDAGGVQYAGKAVTVQPPLAARALSNAAALTAAYRARFPQSTESLPHLQALGELREHGLPGLQAVADRFRLEELGEALRGASLAGALFVEGFGGSGPSYLLALYRGARTHVIAVHAAAAGAGVAQYMFTTEATEIAQFTRQGRIVWASGIPSPGRGRRFFPYLVRNPGAASLELERLVDGFSHRVGR